MVLPSVAGDPAMPSSWLCRRTTRRAASASAAGLRSTTTWGRATSVSGCSTIAETAPAGRGARTRSWPSTWAPRMAMKRPPGDPPAVVAHGRGFPARRGPPDRLPCHPPAPRAAGRRGRQPGRISSPSFRASAGSAAARSPSIVGALTWSPPRGAAAPPQDGRDRDASLPGQVAIRSNPPSRAPGEASSQCPPNGPVADRPYIGSPSRGVPPRTRDVPLHRGPSRSAGPRYRERIARQEAGAGAWVGRVERSQGRRVDGREAFRRAGRAGDPPGLTVRGACHRGTRGGPPVRGAPPADNDSRGPTRNCLRSHRPRAEVVEAVRGRCRSVFARGPRNHSPTPPGARRASCRTTSMPSFGLADPLASRLRDPLEGGIFVRRRRAASEIRWRDGCISSIGWKPAERIWSP